MTIGAKIKFYRKTRNLTQAALASLTGIHLVSIAKYETDKMHPQPTQIAKISEALNVSATALGGVTTDILRMDTRGDLMGLLMLLYEASIIQVKGTRNPDGSIQKDTLQLKFAPMMSTFFDMCSLEHAHSLPDLLIHIKDSDVLDDFLLWDQVSYTKTKAVLSAQTLNDAFAVEQAAQQKDTVELTLHAIETPLDCT